jgi:hypothetical protein
MNYKNIKDTNFINFVSPFSDNAYYKKYIEFSMNTNNINIINNNVLYKYDHNFKLKNTNLMDSIDFIDFIDFIDTNYNLYDTFINLFNSEDKNIIKIGAFGISGSGKTHFLKNIIKIININEKSDNIYDKHGYFRNVSDDIYDIMNRKEKLKKKINLIKKYFYYSHGYFYKILYINLDDNKLTDYIDDIIKIIKKIKISHYKLILLFESYKIKYNNMYDIIYNGRYMTNDEIIKLNEKLDKFNQNKTEFNQNKTEFNQNKTINEIISKRLFN